MRPKKYQAFAILMAVILAGCSKNPNAPDAGTLLTGHWISSDTVEVFTAFDVRMIQNESGIVSGDWVGKTRITNGKCDAEYGCAPGNVVYGSNLSLRIELQILGAGSFEGHLRSKNELEGQVLRFNAYYKLTLHRVD